MRHKRHTHAKKHPWWAKVSACAGVLLLLAGLGGMPVLAAAEDNSTSETSAVPDGESSEAAAYKTAADYDANTLESHWYERTLARALLDGEALAGYDTMNERLLLRLLIEELEVPFDTIALGSSRILQMSADIAQGGSFFNCGVSGADYRDVMNTFYLFERAGKLPKNVIIGLDPWLLNGNEDALHHKSDADLLEEFKAVCLGYENGWQELYGPPADLMGSENDKDKDEHSPDDALPLVEGNPREQHKEAKMPDGQVMYTVDFREADSEVVGYRAHAEALSFLRMSGYLAPDPELCELFHRFVQYMQFKGVNVVLVMLPYHPLVYSYANEYAEVYPGFFLTERWFTQYALDYGVALYGSYSPFVTNNAEVCFYDGLHIRGEAIASIFAGVNAVATDTAAGLPLCSPWMTNGGRVQRACAERVAAERYEITEDERVQLSHDTVIDGELCYTIERYDAYGNLLAHYAVSRREGIIYRLDTVQDAWVVDWRFRQ